ncbi:hypothetical protein KVV02_007766 [Mortierella alpina]|uniref:C2 domain-containing protein n=1 Tax=Mortierella alpina TaxID=64518 RepID=A0A9P8A7C1_MORAP|nr:hypothetical protein KVV02_007766 [Mortierella alpina]
MTQSLKITVHKAEHLDDVEHMGKNDPYAQFSFNVKDNNEFKKHKTSVKKNAGKNPEWNETLSLENFDSNLHHELYVEVLEDDVGIDPPIGFCAIPMSQITKAENKVFRGCYDLFTPSGKPKGTISLTIAVVNAGQAAPACNTAEVKGLSQIVTDHQHRIKTIKTNEKVNDVGLAAGIIGGIFAAKAAHDAMSKPAVPKEL